MGDGILNIQMYATGPWVAYSLIRATEVYICPPGYLLYPSWTENGVTLTPACQRDDPVPPPPKKPAKVIALDPGHGFECGAKGMPPGATGATDFPLNDPPPGRLREDELTMQIARETQKLFSALNYKVVLTKASSTSCPRFIRRGEIANGAKADVFISIHINAPLAVPVPVLHGSSGIRNAERPGSFKWANTLARTVSQRLGVNNRGFLIDNELAVLKPKVTYMDAVILEAARLSSTDEVKLHAPGSAARVAAGIKDAVLELLPNPWE